MAGLLHLVRFCLVPFGLQVQDLVHAFPWQWGLMRLTPSTERIEDLLLDKRWRARLGLKREDGGSPDRVAEILDVLSIDEWNEMMLDDFFIARRARLRWAALPTKKIGMPTVKPRSR